MIGIVMVEPIFYVALAHTDTLAYLSMEPSVERKRVSILNLFPKSFKNEFTFQHVI